MNTHFQPVTIPARSPADDGIDKAKRIKRSIKACADVPTLDDLQSLCVINEAGCWLKIGVRDGWYGHLRVKGKSIRAHRLAWEIVNGPIPIDLVACHRCNTPRCMNPHHIYAATRKQNSMDAGRDGLISHCGHARGPARDNKRKTECLRGHPFAGENLRVLKNGDRVCLTCRRAGDLARYYRRREDGYSRCKSTNESTLGANQ